MLNFTTLIQQCHTLFQHTKLCMLDSLREDETWPCIFPSAITLRPPAHAQGALPSLLHSIRACAGMQTLKRSPPQTTQTSKQKSFSAFLLPNLEWL